MRRPGVVVQERTRVVSPLLIEFVLLSRPPLFLPLLRLQPLLLLELSPLVEQVVGAVVPPVRNRLVTATTAAAAGQADSVRAENSAASSMTA